MTATTEKKDALYFLVEQACCLAQTSGMETEHFRACRDAAEYLVGGNTSAVKAFDERTGAVKRDITGCEDYDTEEYDGKRNDVRAAVIELTGLGRSIDTPDEKRGILQAAADLIAGFYGMDGILEASPA
jgi:hypothetical protein